MVIILFSPLTAGIATGMSGVSAGALKGVVTHFDVYAAMFLAVDNRRAELHAQRSGSQVIWRNFHCRFIMCRSLVRKKSGDCMYARHKIFMPVRVIMLAGKIEMAIGEGFTRFFCPYVYAAG